MFSGNHQHVLDVKGRTSIPAKWRDGLLQHFDERLMVTPEQSGCLAAHPYLRWVQMLERLQNLPQSNPAVRSFLRSYVGRAQEVSIDKQGRILLPPSVRELAGLKKQIVFVGLHDHLEIWDRKAWETELGRISENSEENLRELSKLGF